MSSLVHSVAVLITGASVATTASAQHAGFHDRSADLPAVDRADAHLDSSICAPCENVTSALIGTVTCVDASSPPGERIRGSLWEDPDLGVNEVPPGTSTFIDTVCMAPGDYRDWGVLRLTAHDNPTIKRILRTGAMTPEHPALQTPANQVLIAGLDIVGNFNPTRNWHVQHLTVAPTQTAFSVLARFGKARDLR